MKITLIGYMGCGKTSIGKILSNKLNCDFYDLDRIIIENENNSIYNIFRKKGEKYFRNIEYVLLKNILENNKNSYILSVGGGTPCFYKNIHLLNKYSTTFYLKLTSYSLFKRLIIDKNKRPLISKLSKNNLFKYIINHLSTRIYFYEKSMKKIYVYNKSKYEIAQEIINNI